MSEPLPTNPGFINRIGQGYGDLEIKSYAGKNKRGQALWNCECKCGQMTVARGDHLLSGNTSSCGCALKRGRTTHGGTGSRLYRIWSAMKQRCYNKKVKEYKNYGARGIGICDEWVDDFGAFRDWSLRNGYSDDLSIDRKENDFGYCPQNCRWVTRLTQASNTRRTIPCTAFGETKTVADWLRDSRCKVSRNVLVKRLADDWCAEDAITTPSYKAANYRSVLTVV